MTPAARAWRRFLLNRGAVVGGAMVLAVVGLALIAPWVAGDPLRPDIDHGLSTLGAPLSL